MNMASDLHPHTAYAREASSPEALDNVLRNSGVWTTKLNEDEYPPALLELIETALRNPVVSRETQQALAQHDFPAVRLRVATCSRDTETLYPLMSDEDETVREAALASAHASTYMLETVTRYGETEADQATAFLTHHALTGAMPSSRPHLPENLATPETMDRLWRLENGLGECDHPEDDCSPWVDRCVQARTLEG
ncbi:hypothetical protein ICM05_05375 [Leucobacter sp. cx-42]|uniref:hypothetical protein n=1 Tax=unclassified Leucobacter TaxID=2621730 RepID=UPI00165E6475|nr:MULTISPECIES: hypothetical protein [unclassified Leucobacter]MBC9954077.1 hypothetical protein [Leucobacter sp. cx-42]